MSEVFENTGPRRLSKQSNCKDFKFETDFFSFFKLQQKFQTSDKKEWLATLSDELNATKSEYRAFLLPYAVFYFTEAAYSMLQEFRHHRGRQFLGVDMADQTRSGTIRFALSASFTYILPITPDD